MITYAPMAPNLALRVLPLTSAPGGGSWSSGSVSHARNCSHLSTSSCLTLPDGGLLPWLAPSLLLSLLYSLLISVGTNVPATFKEWTIPLGTAISLP